MWALCVKQATLLGINRVEYLKLIILLSEAFYGCVYWEERIQELIWIQYSYAKWCMSLVSFVSICFVGVPCLIFEIKFTFFNLKKIIHWIHMQISIPKNRYIKRPLICIYWDGKEQSKRRSLTFNIGKSLSISVKADAGRELKEYL